MRAHTCRARTVVVVPLFTLVLTACATALRSPESSDIERTPPRGERSEQSERSEHNVVTSEQLASTHALTTVEALTRLRPEFFQGSARAPLVARPEIAVYLNNSYAGDLSTLGSIPLDAIREIAFLHPADAHMRFGSACMCASGAIVVTIRRLE